MTDEILEEHGLQASPFRSESCPTFNTPVVLLSFVSADDVESPQQIKAARTFTEFAETLPPYVMIRMLNDDDVALMRKACPQVIEYTLTGDQWKNIVSCLRKRHTWTPE